MIHAVQTFGLILVELLVLFSLISVLVALVNRRFGPDRIQSWMADWIAPGLVEALIPREDEEHGSTEEVPR